MKMIYCLASNQASKSGICCGSTDHGNADRDLGIRAQVVARSSWTWAIRMIKHISELSSRPVPAEHPKRGTSEANRTWATAILAEYAIFEQCAEPLCANKLHIGTGKHRIVLSLCT
jgi:hypothetical protein